ncbi:ABC transporter permease [Occallatibacter riparius]|uniref:ABC transporter permease n=1 Tax=Occallatibacter riparius TaxID=1002689 RepID=A0A9J7BMV8_9BACT|nr:ABC transporter permease [Occallatibacter riparius]UWZ84220.1 ABC transporter permease [Occallatibacter riparius]
MFGDLKLALRQLGKSPGFVVTAIVTLALGIGANAIVFSVLNALVLRPVNVPHPDNLYMVQRFTYPSHSYPDYLDLRDKNRTFQNLVTFDIVGPQGVDTGGNPSTAWPFLASGNYFDALEIQPYLGRFFHASDEKGDSSAPYVVLSYAYWHSYFHGDKNVVGKPVSIDKHPMTIIGVAPPDFRGTELFFAPAMWIPMVEKPTLMGSNLKERGNHSLFVIGRLKPGVTATEATADLNALGAWMAKTYPAQDDGIKFTLARPGLVGDMLGGPAKAFMAGLMGLAGLILLAACANLGSLFAARAADRAKEVALRLALGSKRGLILRQLLTEAMMVSLAGGVVGLGGGIVLLRMLSAWQPIPDVPINVPVNPDVRTYAVALVLALVSGLLFGIVPVRQVMRSDPWQVIRTGQSVAGAMRRFTMRDVLLVVQIAICGVLVTSSFVAVRGLARSLHSNFGFQPQNVVLASTDLRMSGYKDDDSSAVQKRMIDAIAAIPGVTAVGSTSNIPLGLGGGDSSVYKDTTTDFRPTNSVADAMNYNVSPGYLEASGTRLLAGRNFKANDDKNAPTVAIVNHEFAVKVFGSVEKAVGGHFKFWGGKRAEVIGVVEDGRYRTLTEDQMAAMFFSYQQHTDTSTWLVVRSNREPSELIPALEKTLHGVDPSLPLGVLTWTEEMDSALFAARVATVALGALGMLGAMLAVTGIFGMASYTVSKRMRELGIRVALGAGQKQILGASLGRAFRLLSIGSIAGVVLGLMATRVLSFIVYQATPKDPWVLGGVSMTMLVLGLLASLLPARRALAVNPLVLLKDE